MAIRGSFFFLGGVGDRHIHETCQMKKEGKEDAGAKGLSLGLEGLGPEGWREPPPTLGHVRGLSARYVLTARPQIIINMVYFASLLLLLLCCCGQPTLYCCGGEAACAGGHGYYNLPIIVTRYTVMQFSVQPGIINMPKRMAAAEGVWSCVGAAVCRVSSA